MSGIAADVREVEAREEAEAAEAAAERAERDAFEQRCARRNNVKIQVMHYQRLGRRARGARHV